jgi:hypothetical protein
MKMKKTKNQTLGCFYIDTNGAAESSATKPNQTT